MEKYNKCSSGYRSSWNGILKQLLHSYKKNRSKLAQIAAFEFTKHIGKHFQEEEKKQELP